MSRPTPVAVRRVTLGVVITTLLLAAWKLPILESVAGITVLEPTAVWYVMQDGNSQIKTGWESNLLGSGGEQTMIEFNGSDIVRIEIYQNLRNGSIVSVGDTVATILSLATESTIGELEARTAIARANYSALKEGSRPVDIEVAKRKVEFADASLEAFRPDYERNIDFHSKGLVPLEKLQADEGKYQTLLAAKSLAESNLEALMVGARLVDMDVASAEIDRLERMLDYARQRHELRRALISPVPGILEIGEDIGVIISIVRTDTLAAFVSLPESMLSDIKPDSRVKVTLAIDGRIVSGVFNRIIFRKTPMRGSTVVALIDNRDGSLKPGMHGHGEVETKPRSLLSSVNRTLRARSR